MSAQNWCWSTIVNPQLADAAIATLRRRQERRRANDDGVRAKEGREGRAPAAA